MLSKSHVCLHTAAWETMPIAVLEAAAIGLPVVARSIPPIQDTPVGQLINSPREGAEQMQQLASVPGAWDDLARRTRASLAAMHESWDVKSAVARVYGLEEIGKPLVPGP
jgi:glycosyltransferase involved in cell wall biosynthesis